MTVAALWDQRKSRIVEGELLTEWTYQDFKTTQRMWQSFKDTAGERSISADESGEWNWPQKFVTRTAEDRFLGVGVEGRPQGLMHVRLGWSAENANGAMRPPVVYIEHLETAPWNLLRYVGKNDRLYRQVGTSLIVAAIALSKSVGLSGRVGLHSLELAETFYNSLLIRQQKVFKDLGSGYLPHSELRYFEHSE